jgi:tripartite-type tricarboxylate transporter receptor subunit TctC
MSIIRRRALGALVLGAVLAGALPAQAQTFPDRPVKIIVPQPPGGGFDTVARIVADRLQPLLGQAVIVENKPGAGTLVGTDLASKAAPDGYTLLLGGVSNMAFNVGLYPKLSYDPVRDFTPVAMVVSWPYMLIARKDLPQNSFKELIDFVRANPGKLNYASAGRGTGQHLASAVLGHLARLDMVHVPYSGAQPAYQDLLGGRIDLFFDNSSTALPQVKGEKVKAFAVSTARRYGPTPELPSVKETGVADMDMDSWFGLFAPRATPQPVLERLRAEMAKVRADSSVVEVFAKSGGAMSTMSPAEAEAFARAEAEHWGKLIRDAGVTAE